MEDFTQIHYRILDLNLFLFPLIILDSQGGPSGVSAFFHVDGNHAVAPNL